jgi:alpha-tubulin suppressor-like RCC1 family protein
VFVLRSDNNAQGVARKLTGVVDVAAGDAFTCALLANGTVVCWGANTRGQLGDNSTTGRSSANVLSKLVKRFASTTSHPTLAQVTAITAGAQHACAVVDLATTVGSSTVQGGTMRCWGANGSRQLGNGGTSGPETCTATPSMACSKSARLVKDVGGSGALQQVFAISGGGAHTCAVRGTGEVLCWGKNDKGQVGVSGTSNRSSPVLVDIEASGPAAGVAAGTAHTCAWLADGNMTCWGKNDTGQLGNGTTSTAANPDPATIRF